MRRTTGRVRAALVAGAATGALLLTGCNDTAPADEDQQEQQEDGGGEEQEGGGEDDDG